MPYKTILILSGAFIILLMLTIMQQIVSFFQNQNNPVSSINVLRSDNGFIDSSVVLFSAFIVSEPESVVDSVDLLYEKFNVSDHCRCLNSSLSSEYKWESCHRILRMDDPDIDSQVLIFEAPVNYGAFQTEALICDHLTDPIVVFMFIVVAQSFEQMNYSWTLRNSSERSELVDELFNGHIHHWVHCNFYTNLRLTKTEYFRDHRPNRIHIDVSSSTTENLKKGQTRMNFAWLDGTVTRIDKFTDRSVWSFAMLLCAVLLGLERCYSIITRAKAQNQKHRSRRKEKGEKKEQPPDLNLIDPENNQTGIKGNRESAEHSQFNQKKTESAAIIENKNFFNV